MNAHGFADVDHATTCEVTTVTKRANTTLGLAAQYGTNHHSIDAGIFDLCHGSFVKFGTSLTIQRVVSADRRHHREPHDPKFGHQAAQ